MGMDMMVNSNINGDASPTPEGVSYELFYRPVQGSSYKAEKAGRMTTAFDLINLNTDDQSTATLFLNGMMLEWKPLALLDSSFTTETVFEFASGTEGWQLRTVPKYFDPPTPLTGPSFLGLRSAGFNTFGYWESPPQPVVSGRLYRTRFWIKTDVTDRSKVPMMRLRVNSIINHTGYTLSVDSGGNGDSSPITTSWTMYELYYSVPKSVEADGVWIAFDLVNLNLNDEWTGAL